MSFIKSTFVWILLLGSIGLWVYTDSFKKGVCESPIRYSLGMYDERFGISQAEFKNAVDDATVLWEDATGKNLFEYEANPKPASEFYKYAGRLFYRKDIPVNLVYDERQQNSEEHRTLVSEVNEQKQVADSVKRQFLSLQDRYKTASAEYKTLLDRYKKRQVSYDVVEAKRLEVNALADEVNALVKKYNSLVGELNMTVRTINATAGQEFEEGEYVLDQNGERITIFEFGDRSTLVRVLAHEFGHAMGLDHNDNPDSIMYYLNDSSNMMPTEEDLADLGAVCKGA